MQNCDIRMLGFDGHECKCNRKGKALLHLECGSDLMLENAFLVTNCSQYLISTIDLEKDN